MTSTNPLLSKELNKQSRLTYTSNPITNLVINLTAGRQLNTILTLILTFISSLIVGFVLSMLLVLPAADSKPILSPQPEILPARTEKSPPTNFAVLGFLPFWRIGQIDSLYLNSLTEIAFFSLTTDRFGNFVKTTDDGFAEPGWHKFRSPLFTQLRVRQSGRQQKLTMTIALMDREEIISFLDSSAAQTNLINNIITLSKGYQIDGLNIDFEYSGIPPKQTMAQFSQFIKTLRQTLNQEIKPIKLSVDVHADSLIRARLQNIADLAAHVDYLVIMAYDFFRINSAYSGPVAPLYSGDTYDYSVSQTVNDFLNIVPANKLILGIPFYGYEWQTSSDLQNSQTISGSGAIASYQRVKKIINEQCPAPEANCQFSWDEPANSPYLIYQPDPYSIRQIYYENEKSISAKIALARHHNLAGIAFWALGYDGADSDLWSAINTALSRRPSP